MDFYLSEVGISSAEVAPADRHAVECKSVATMQYIADSLWLGDALIENRVVLLLAIGFHSSKDRIFGYESFARVEKCRMEKVVGGMQIMAASKSAWY